MWGELRAGSKEAEETGRAAEGGGRFQQEEGEETRQPPDGRWKFWPRTPGCPIRSLQTSPALLLRPELQQTSRLLSHPQLEQSWSFLSLPVELATFIPRPSSSSELGFCSGLASS